MPATALLAEAAAEPVPLLLDELVEESLKQRKPVGQEPETNEPVSPLGSVSPRRVGLRHALSAPAHAALMQHAVPPEQPPAPAGASPPSALQAEEARQTPGKVS